jgi:hypothetical protein
MAPSFRLALMWMCHQAEAHHGEERSLADHDNVTVSFNEST